MIKKLEARNRVKGGVYDPYNGTDGYEDTEPEDYGGHDAFLDHVDDHYTDEEDYDRELDTPVWQHVSR
jgi:hypothetical protein